MVIKTAKPLDNAFIVKAIRDKLNNNHRLQRLQDYYEGKHDILLRHYADVTKPNNRIVINYCKYIADFLTSYLVGVPVKYEAPQLILDLLNYNDNDEVTQEIVLNMNRAGFAAELLYNDADGVARFASIDPRESIFVMDDSIEEVLTAFIRVYPKEDESEGYNVTVYTATDYTHYDLSLAIGELKAGETVPHLFQDVPAILYPNNKELIGTFEGVMSLQDALNKIVSDEVNDQEQFTDAYLVLSGLQATQPEDIAKMKSDRVLLLDDSASAQWLVKNVNTEHIKELKESITTKICILGNVPSMTDLGSFGASGVALKFKLLSTEMQGDKQERVLKRGVQRRLELLYNILRITDPAIGDYTDVKIEFIRNFIMLAEDKAAEMQIDLQRYNAGLISKTQFLIKHDNLTPKEAQEEIEQMDKETPFGFGEFDLPKPIFEKENTDEKEQ